MRLELHIIEILVTSIAGHCLSDGRWRGRGGIRDLVRRNLGARPDGPVSDTSRVQPPYLFGAYTVPRTLRPITEAIRIEYAWHASNTWLTENASNAVACITYLYLLIR